MSTLTLADSPTDQPAQRLRRLAAAVRVHFTWWGTHKTLSAQQKEEMGLTCAADVRFLTAGKKLIDTRHDAFRRLTSVRTQIISFWKGLSLPYVEPGVRLIRQSDIESFVHKLEGFREELRQAEAELNEVYGEIRSDARERLGKLFNPEDYPAEIANLFAVEWDFPSIEPPNYLMRLNPDLYAEEQNRIQRRFEEAVQLAEQAFLGEFSKLIAHLTERLSTGQEGEAKIFRDSAVVNLQEFFERFKNLNVRSNSQLDELVGQAQRIVQGVGPQELRNNGGLRQQIATQMAGVQSVLDGMMVDRPRRTLLRNKTAKGEP